MDNFFISDDHTPCWVYIMNSGGRGYSIGYSLHKLQACETNDDNTTGCEIVWYRRFVGIANGLAYKLFLEHISDETLEWIVKYNNKKSY